MYSRGIEKVRKPSVYAGFRTSNIYSNSTSNPLQVMNLLLFRPIYVSFWYAFTFHTPHIKAGVPNLYPLASLPAIYLLSHHITSDMLTYRLCVYNRITSVFMKSLSDKIFKCDFIEANIEFLHSCLTYNNRLSNWTTDRTTDTATELSYSVVQFSCSIFSCI